ncbi:MAG: hypothetical protein MUQ67_07370, partial [Pirellulales bacterium]|nr:hypothetical protein [Pirellulales bacterium]
HFYFRVSASHDHHVLRSARRSTNPQEQSFRRSPPLLRRPAAAEILLEINSVASSTLRDIDSVRVPGPKRISPEFRSGTFV